MNLLDLSFSELEALIRDLGESRFRASQVFQWVWQKGCPDFALMTNLSGTLRTKLGKAATLSWPDLDTVKVSRDGTVKFLLRMADGALVETVLIPGEGRLTQCLSTQVGCPLGCTFCATGLMGFTRNLTSGEILGQVLVARRYALEQGLSPLKNLVFMGMGEPLLNLPQLAKSLEVLNHDLGLGFSRRRITVSSVGLPDKLAELGPLGLALPAISLHAPTQELRARIMPVAARVSLDALMAALRAYPMRARERITFEYLLLGGVNDGPAEAKALVRLLGQMRCKVNLIAYNATPGLPYEAPDMDRVLAFENYLKDKRLSVTLRRSMGADIAAACGQLKAARTGELGAGITPEA